MAFSRQIAIILILYSCYTGEAKAQLWRYLNDSPESEKAYDRALEKEACSVITKNDLVDSMEITYKVRTYPIQSFDNISSKISLMQRPFSGKLKINCTNDSLAIYDFYSLARVHILSKDLLEIVYSPRGGSNQGYDNVLILGLNKGKFCVVMEIQSVNEFEYDDEYGLYNLHLILMGQNVYNYQLSLSIRDLLRSKTKRLKSYDRHSQYVLKFDEKRKIFYNDFKDVNATVDIWDPIANKTRQEQLTANYPVIKLGDLEYYYIGDIWYAGGKDVTNGKYSFVAYCQRVTVR